jgi:hypothetical protein
MANHKTVHWIQRTCTHQDCLTPKQEIKFDYLKP